MLRIGSRSCSCLLAKCSKSVQQPSLVHITRRGGPRTTGVVVHAYRSLHVSRTVGALAGTSSENDVMAASSPVVIAGSAAVPGPVYPVYDLFKRRPLFTRKFLNKYKEETPKFGFNGVGELVYRRTYARIKPETGEQEQWFETVQRVVEGTFLMQYKWSIDMNLGWDHNLATKRAHNMYDRMFHFKFLPPGRGLYYMNSSSFRERGLHAALNNCAFVSTDIMHDTNEKKSKPFCFLMDMLMLGVGVGFDAKGAEPAKGKNALRHTGVIVKGVDARKAENVVIVEDSREGWVESVAALIDSYFDQAAPIHFDYSLIREPGSPIKSFGGTAPGPAPLKLLHKQIRSTLDPLCNQPITVTAITDLMNHIGVCIAQGSVRQSALIAFGDPTDEEYLDLKNYEANPHRTDWGWSSNNSIHAKIGTNYKPSCDRLVKNGEPGFAWLETMQQYGRLCDPPDNKDYRAMGGNPCLEQTLESFELCCLVETFPNNHENLEDYKATLEMAFLYAKTVTLGKVHYQESNRVMMRNRRIGCSMSGIAQFLAAKGLPELHEWSLKGYSHLKKIDQELSDEFAVPQSIKISSIKPSGSVSLLAGATPGLHYPHARFYIRRVRVPTSCVADLAALEAAGYEVVDALESKTSKVVSFPVDVGEGVRTAASVSMWEQLSLAAFLQRYWADNQVSATITFDREKEGHQIVHALEYFQYQLKGVSFLPLESGYQQTPYEEISEKKYEEMKSKLKPIKWTGAVAPVADTFCDSDKCVVLTRN